MIVDPVSSSTSMQSMQGTMMLQARHMRSSCCRWPLAHHSSTTPQYHGASCFSGDGHQAWVIATKAKAQLAVALV